MKRSLPNNDLRRHTTLVSHAVRRDRGLKPQAITLNDDQALFDYAQPMLNELRANMVRVDSDFSATPFKAKIANAEQLRVHTMLIIGGKDMEDGSVSVRLHHGGPQGAKPKAEVMAQILASIKDAKGVINFRKQNGPRKNPAGRFALLFTYSWITRSMRLSGTSQINATHT